MKQIIQSGSITTVDIGNSSIGYAVYAGKRLLRHGWLQSRSLDALWQASSMGRKPVVFVVASVVPALNSKLKTFLRAKSNVRGIYFAGRDLRIPLKSHYDMSQAGADRLVNVYGAKQFYGGPCLIIDFGTAVTFDYLSKQNVYEGGLIVPGLWISAEALHRCTAQLPSLKKLSYGRSWIGRTTRDAVSSGLLNGFGAMADGLIGRFRKRDSRPLRVIATGGYAGLIAMYSKEIQRVDQMHTLKALKRVYDDHHNLRQGTDR